MKTQQLYEDKFLEILWNDESRVSGIDWKEATSSMTGEELKKELTLFADEVEAKKAHGILVDVKNFRHKPGPDTEEWRVSRIFRAVTTLPACADSRSCFPRTLRCRP
jgi:hypothetical protein